MVNDPYGAHQSRKNNGGNVRYRWDQLNLQTMIEVGDLPRRVG